MNRCYGKLRIDYQDRLVRIIDVTVPVTRKALLRYLRRDCPAAFAEKRDLTTLWGEFRLHRWAYRLGFFRDRARVVDCEACPPAPLLWIYRSLS